MVSNEHPVWRSHCQEAKIGWTGGQRIRWHGEVMGSFLGWLLLDSRVVDLPRAYHLTSVMLSSLKPLFFNSLKNELCFSDNAGA